MKYNILLLVSVIQGRWFQHTAAVAAAANDNDDDDVSVYMNVEMTLAHTVFSSTRSNFSQLMRFTASAGGWLFVNGTRSRSVE